MAKFASGTFEADGASSILSCSKFAEQDLELHSYNSAWEGTTHPERAATPDATAWTPIKTFGRGRNPNTSVRLNRGDKVRLRTTGLSTELITNGAFASDTGWTKGDEWAIGSGVATKTATTAQDLEQAVDIKPGCQYKLTYTLTRTAGTITVKLGGTTVRTHAASVTAAVEYVTVEPSTIQATPLIEFQADLDFGGTVDNVLLVPANDYSLCLEEAVIRQDIAPSGTVLRTYFENGTHRTEEVRTPVENMPFGFKRVAPRVLHYELGTGLIIEFDKVRVSIADADSFGGTQFLSAPPGGVNYVLTGGTQITSLRVLTNRAATINDNADLTWGWGTIVASNITLSGDMLTFSGTVETLTLDQAGRTLHTDNEAMITAIVNQNYDSADTGIWFNVSITTNTLIDADGIIDVSGNVMFSYIWGMDHLDP